MLGIEQFVTRNRFCFQVRKEGLHTDVVEVVPLGGMAAMQIQAQEFSLLDFMCVRIEDMRAH